MKIAVFLNEENKTIHCNEAGIVNIYTKDKGEWIVVRKIPLDISNIDDANIIRKEFINMVESLGECEVFVGAEVLGFFYSILESRGINVWGIEGSPEEFLEVVLQNEEYNKAKSIKAEKPIEKIPVPTLAGKVGSYYIDLRPIMKNNEKINSKDVLVPFLNANKFEDLTVECDHVPPWFEKELKILNLESSVECINDNLFKVKIYHV